MSLERVIIYLEAYAYDVCAWHRQVIALWVANEAISAGDENYSAWWIPRALVYDDGQNGYARTGDGERTASDGSWTLKVAPLE